MAFQINHPNGSRAALAAISFHDELADAWDAAYSSGAFKRRAALVGRVLDTLPLHGQEWLDAGCGSGYFSRILVERGARVLAIDASLPMLANATRLAESGRLGDRLIFRGVDTIERMDLGSQTFDGVLCLSVIEYLSSPDHAFWEFARLVKPGGTVLLSVPCKRSPVRAALQVVRKTLAPFGCSALAYLDLSINAYTQPKLERVLHDAGLQPLAFYSFDPLLPQPLLRLLPGSLMFVVARRMP